MFVLGLRYGKFILYILITNDEMLAATKLAPIFSGQERRKSVMPAIVLYYS